MSRAPVFVLSHVSRRSHAAVLACLLLAGGAGAQEREAKEEPISADRPDFVENSDVVGKGRVQVETSFLSERERAHDEEGRRRTYSMPTMLRIGVSEAVELRIETDGRTVEHSWDVDSGERSTAAGYADTDVGFSWHVADGDAGTGRPSVGVVLGAGAF